MQDQNRKKDIASALRGDHEVARSPDMATPTPDTEVDSAHSAFDQQPASRAGDGKIHAIGPAPGVRPVRTDMTDPDRSAPRSSASEPAPATRKLTRWVVGGLVAGLALWLLLGWFG